MRSQLSSLFSIYHVSRTLIFFSFPLTECTWSSSGFSSLSLRPKRLLTSAIKQLSRRRVRLSETYFCIKASRVVQIVWNGAKFQTHLRSLHKEIWYNVQYIHICADKPLGRARFDSAQPEVPLENVWSELFKSFGTTSRKSLHNH